MHPPLSPSLLSLIVDVLLMLVKALLIGLNIEKPRCQITGDLRSSLDTRNCLDELHGFFDAHRMTYGDSI